VLFRHRVGNAANADLDAFGGDLDDRHMFFLGGVGGVFLQLAHGLAAAHQRGRAAVQHLDNVATGITFVDALLFGCHEAISFHGG
jgi:hypothetical protein